MPASTKPSVGQALAEPSQASATSQIPADARQTSPEAFTASAGQAFAIPSQYSSASQAPACARHTRVAGRTAQMPFEDAPARTLHTWQSEKSPFPQALSQQTPSVQKPDWQSEARPQSEPRARNSEKSQLSQ
ncbi:MAG TPA: hypothetical protein VGK67_25775 [Myxococcales bacterium]